MSVSYLSIVLTISVMDLEAGANGQGLLKNGVRLKLDQDG